jgi:hypothetical protein
MILKGRGLHLYANSTFTTKNRVSDIDRNYDERYGDKD